MADEDRTTAHGIEFLQKLADTPYRFHFDQALRRLECHYRRHPRLGKSLRAADDPVRLGQEPSMAFAPSTISSYKPGAAGRPGRLETYFYGLFGPNGPLPLHLTEYARDRMKNSDDFTFVRFADMFHHRMLSLFYRAWADAQPTVQFDRPETDRFAAFVGATFGLGMPSLRNRDAMPDLAKLYFAGRLACQTRHAEGLAAILREFFKLPIGIEEFVGHWLRLPDNCRCQLGHSAESAGLGVTATIGERVWDCQQKFRVTVGPIGYRDYERLLPGGDSLARLIAVVHNYIGLELTWDVHLILKKQEVPEAELGRRGQLGWSTWLVSQPRPADSADLILDPQQEHRHN
jgi:type VI secretion system protein ImpH